MPLTKADSHNKPMAHTLRVKGKSDSETICDGWRERCVLIQKPGDVPWLFPAKYLKGIEA
ncbi:hypothetical protein M9Y22_23325 [Escherichia coli]|nr:hypothetical protein [Escherichia coli]